MSTRMEVSGEAAAQVQSRESEFRFHHIGVAVHSLEGSIAAYENLFGYRLQSGPWQDPVQRVEVCFLEKDSEPQLELVAPLDGESPIRNILSKGGGAYHICFEVADIRQSLARLARQGCLVVSPPVPATAFDGRSIAWCFTNTRQLIELVEAPRNLAQTELFERER